MSISTTSRSVSYPYDRTRSCARAQCGKTAEEVAAALDWTLPPEDPAELFAILEVDHFQAMIGPVGQRTCRSRR